MRLLGDFDVAEEIVQDTLLLALERWRRDGIPDRPGAWLTTAARRRSLDRLRRDARFRVKLELLEAEAAGGDVDEPDDRLRLIFTCCHPSLSARAQVVVRLNRAVALRWVVGPEAALAEVDALAADLDGYHLLHATRAELLRELGRREAARAAELRALDLTANRAERSLLERRLSS